jgi:hypothetical protein
MMVLAGFKRPDCASIIPHEVKQDAFEHYKATRDKIGTEKLLLRCTLLSSNDAQIRAITGRLSSRT